MIVEELREAVSKSAGFARRAEENFWTLKVFDSYFSLPPLCVFGKPKCEQCSNGESSSQSCERIVYFTTAHRSFVQADAGMV
jgi:hypothetical protein